MPASKVRSDHEQLNQIAQRFERESERITGALQQIRRQLEVLRGGDWLGKGADKFYAEMDSAVLPALQRLAAALSQAARITTRISQVMQQAEDDAAALFRGGAVGGAGSASAGAGAAMAASGGSGSGSGGAGSASGGSGGRGASGAGAGAGAQGGDGARSNVGTPNPQPDLKEIYNDFRPPLADNSELVKAPPVPMQGVQTRYITSAEWELIKGLGLAGMAKFFSIEVEAQGQARQIYPTDIGQEDGPGDAVRHAYFSARLAEAFGPEWASKFTTQHERIPGNEKHKAFMDLWNNRIGIDIASQHPGASAQELAHHVYEAVKSGRAVVIENGGLFKPFNPIYSDQDPLTKVLVDPQSGVVD